MRMSDLLKWIYAKGSNYNLFMLEETDYDDDEDIKDPAIVLKHQKIKTWLYVGLLAVCLYMLLYVTLMTMESKTIGVSHLTPDLYKTLLIEHAQSLSCPCKKVIIPYSGILFNNITMHPICSSVFVDQEWIESLYFSNASLFGVWDFRTTAFSQFKLLSTFCSLAKEIVFEVRTSLNNTDLVTMELLSEMQVQQEFNAIVDIQKSNAFSRLISFLNYLRPTIQGNYLVTGLGTNWLVEVVYFNATTDATVGTSVKYYIPPLTTLTCSTRSVLIAASLPPFSNISINYVRRSNMQALTNSTLVPGFFTGCTPLEALLQSTLRCLYERNCLQLLSTYFPNLNRVHWNLTDSILTSKYENITVLDYLNLLFIEHWSISINYSFYFDQCAPSVCTYTIKDRVALSYAVALLISLYGGLVCILRLFVSYTVDNLLKFQFYPNNNQNQPIHSLKRLNLFKNIHQRTENSIKQQRIITRIYLILLIGLICCLCLYMTLSHEIVIKTVPNPSITTYTSLENIHSTTLECPCSNQTISYHLFLSFSPTLHPICSSGFVGADWISILKNAARDLVMNDWRNQAHQHFQTLSEFCQLANKTINSAIKRFLSQVFITASMMNESNFNEQLNASIHQFYRSTVYNFDLVKSMVQLIMQVDQFYSGSLISTLRNYNTKQVVNKIINETTNVTRRQIQFIPNGILEINSTSMKCNCLIDPSCQSQAVVYDSAFNYIWGNDINLIHNVSGWIQGCLSIDSLQFSTFECLYANSNCFPLLLSYLFSTYYFSLNLQSFPVRIKPLVYNPMSSRFPPATSILQIIKELMVDHWNPSWSYESFYQTCAPTFCSYSQQIRKEDFIGVVMTLVSMISGIMVCLRLFTSHLVKLIFGFSTTFRRNAEPVSVQVARADRWKLKLQNFKKFLHTKIIELNIFTLRDLGSEVDRVTAKRFGKWATRLYIVLYVSAVVILAFYTIIRPYALTKTFDEPSLRDYNELRKIYGDDLKCRCSKIAFVHNEFVNISPIFHPICTSDVVSEDWRFALVKDLDTQLNSYDPQDYRRFLSAHLQYLQGLCQLSIQAIKHSIDEFLSSLFVTVELLSEINFENRLNLSIEQNKINAPILFARLLSTTQLIFHGNAMISTYGMNFNYKMFVDSARYVYAYTEPTIYDDQCSCGLSANCTFQGAFIEKHSSRKMTIKGIRMGCTPSQSLFASTLACFYDPSCLHLIENYTNYKHLITPLSTTNLRQFSENTTLAELTNHLFIEEWSTQINYATYYQQCAPSLCSYTTIEKLNIFRSITVILGIQGGLTIVLKWLCPKLVRIGSKIYDHRKKRSTTVHIHTTSMNLRFQNHFVLRHLSIFKIALIILLFLCIVGGTSVFSVFYLRSDTDHGLSIPWNTTTHTQTTAISTTTSGALIHLILDGLYLSMNKCLFSEVPLCHPTFYQRSVNTSCALKSPSATVMIDVNADNFLDFIFPCQYDQTVNILLGNGDGTFQPEMIIQLEVYSWIYHLLMNDINNDGQIDLILAQESEIRILFGYVNGTFQTSNALSIAIDGFPRLITVIDLNQDGMLDIVLTIEFEDYVFIYLANVNGTFTLDSKLFVSYNSNLQQLMVADFNNDTSLDIAVFNTNSLHIHMFYMNKNNANFQSQQWFFTAIDAVYSGAVVGDFDSDGRLDIAFLNGWRRLICLLYRNYNDTFRLTEQTMIESSILLNSIAIGDINGDHHLDIILATVQYYKIYALLGTGNGNFQIQSIHSSDYYTNTLWNTVTDLNNDRCHDLVTINVDMNNIDLFLNTCDCA